VEPQPIITPKQDIQEAARYVITYAQNATPVNKQALQSLRAYCSFNKAQLVVIAGRYKNPTSVWTVNMEHDEWWDDSIVKYLLGSTVGSGGQLVGGTHDIGPHLRVHGDLSIQPTAERPLSGLEIFAGGCSAIFGHPKRQLVSIATGTREHTKLLVTTGAITVPNYTASKSGKKSEAHHTYGAVVVERDGDLFHLRHISINRDGSFYDLNYRYDGTKRKRVGSIPALVCGDIHVDKPAPDVLQATFTAKDSIVATLKPKMIVYHDLLDFNLRNHHRIQDQHHMYEHGSTNVEEELHRCAKFIHEMTPDDSLPVVVASNHDEAFDRWLKTVNVQHDMVNAKLYHAMWLLWLTQRDACGEWVPAFEMWYKNSGYDRAQFVRRNQSFKVCDVECGFHGDKGLNGSAGSPTAYAKLGVKVITGHTHSPFRMHGVCTVGVTGALDQGYNYLPSSWLHAHVAVYPDGKRTHLFVINGKWRRPAVE
jgi:hypothetical protein